MSYQLKYACSGLTSSDTKLCISINGSMNELLVATHDGAQSMSAYPILAVTIWVILKQPLNTRYTTYESMGRSMKHFYALVSGKRKSHQSREINDGSVGTTLRLGGDTTFKKTSNVNTSKERITLNNGSVGTTSKQGSVKIFWVEHFYNLEIHT